MTKGCTRMLTNSYTKTRDMFESKIMLSTGMTLLLHPSKVLDIKTSYKMHLTNLLEDLPSHDTKFNMLNFYNIQNVISVLGIVLISTSFFSPLKLSAEESNHSNDKTQTQRKSNDKYGENDHRIISGTIEEMGESKELLYGAEFRESVIIKLNKTRTRKGSIGEKTEENMIHRFSGAAARCMKDLCWLPLARAYVLGVFTLNQEVNGYDDTSYDIEREKTFVFAFLSNKDAKHIRLGFERSLIQCISGNPSTNTKSRIENEELRQFLSILKRPVSKGDKLSVVCLPREQRTLIFWNDRLQFSIDGFFIPRALHRLYFGDENFGPKYESMAKLFRSKI